MPANIQAEPQVAGETVIDRLTGATTRWAAILALPAGIAIGAMAMGLLHDRSATGVENAQTGEPALTGLAGTAVQEPGPKMAGASSNGGQLTADSPH